MLFHLFFLFSAVRSQYVSFRIHTSTSCTASSLLFEWVFSLPTNCTNKPFNKYVSFSQNPLNPMFVNSTIYSDEDCTEKESNISYPLNTCHEYVNSNLSSDVFYINVSVSLTPSYNRSDVRKDHWSYQERFKDKECQEPFTAIGESERYSVWRQGLIDDAEKKSTFTIHEYCTTNNFVRVYLGSNPGVRITPISKQGTCISKNNSLFYEFNSNIKKCLNESELSKFISQFPTSSTHGYLITEQSYNVNCTLIFSSNPKKLDTCNNEVIQIADDNHYIFKVYLNSPDCSSEVFSYAIRQYHTSMFDDSCYLYDTDDREPLVVLYVQFRLSNDHFFPRLMAIGVSKTNCSEGLDQYLKDPSKFYDLWYYNDVVCMPVGTDIKSLRGICSLDKGELWVQTFKESVFCFGDHYDFKAKDFYSHNRNEMCIDGTPDTYVENGAVHFTCIPRYCHGLDEFDSQVCSGHGSCIGNDICDCNKGQYTGSTCEISICYDIREDNEEVCDGNGVCISHDKCVCNKGWSGKKCMISNFAFFSGIFFPTVGGLMSFSVLFVCICCSVCCATCMFIIFSCLLGILCLSSFSVFQKTKISKFKQLDNFNVLLAEQKHEKDTSIAHLTINKKFFQIEYDEVKIEKMIGPFHSNIKI